MTNIPSRPNGVCSADLKKFLMTRNVAFYSPTKSDDALNMMVYLSNERIINRDFVSKRRKKKSLTDNKLINPIPPKVVATIISGAA